jgi:glucosylceramidase
MSYGVYTLAFAAAAAAQKVEWVQTARHKDDTVDLLKDMPTFEMQPIQLSQAEADKALIVDTSKTFQEILGFGGAFTEASAINWRKLSKADQDKVIHLYFSSPEEGGLGYTLGRVPMNSCDFSPASYTFDDVDGDMELTSFDSSVGHDVTSGMIPMILQAQESVKARGHPLKMYTSPWSPPAWMKEAVWGQQSMLLSAEPTGLMKSMQRPWAKYFSKFIAAYRAHGIDMWGVTVQNEPEAAVGWEACLWTPEYMATFVRDHLGPVLEAEQPGVKIIGFDHNKDHVYNFAKAAYSDPEAAKYFYGMGVHWYGGLNAKNLDDTHNLDPSKVILATEACNCGGVVFKDATFHEGTLTKGKYVSAWWSRAESLGLDILVDLQWWAVGWTDWNLVLNIEGGPNHLKNLCDGNIIADHDLKVGDETLILQASYYYMGHFSRYLPPGSKRVGLSNTVEAAAPPLAAGDVKDEQFLLFAPCDGNDAQKWQYNAATHSLRVRDTDTAESSDGYGHGGMCMDYTVMWGWFSKLQVNRCAGRDPPPEDGGLSSLFDIIAVPGGSQIVHRADAKCVTAVSTTGDIVGLDKGLKVIAAQLMPCLAAGEASQTFSANNYDAQGFPGNFPIRTLPSAPGGGELCLQPQIARTPHFSAVAFQAPDEVVSLVVINVGDRAIDFNLYDQQAQAGVRHLTMPSHAIHTYRWSPGKSPAMVGADALPMAALKSAALKATPTTVDRAGLQQLLATEGTASLEAAMANGPAPQRLMKPDGPAKQLLLAQMGTTTPATASADTVLNAANAKPISSPFGLFAVLGGLFAVIPGLVVVVGLMGIGPASMLKRATHPAEGGALVRQEEAEYEAENVYEAFEQSGSQVA